MRKRLLSMALAVTLVLGLGTAAVAANEAPRVYIDGVEFQYDVAAYGQMTAVSGRIYAPLRVLAEKLGYVVDFVDGKATVDGPKGKVAVDLGKLESMSFAVGSETVTLDVPVAMVVNNRTLIALRGLGEAIGCDVEWKDGAAWISTPGGAGSVENESKPPAETTNGIATIIAYEDFDPTKLEKTAAMGDNIAKNWPNDSASGITKDGRDAFLALVQSNGVSAQIYATHNGSGVAIMGGPFSEPLSWSETSKWIDAFYSETVNDNLRTNAMKVLNDLAARYAAGEKTNENVTGWFEENLYDHGYPIGDGYIITFDSAGISIEPSTAILPENLRNEFPWFNK